MSEPWENDPIVDGDSMPSVIPLPMSPQDRAREGRDISASNRDDLRTGIAVRGEQRDINYRQYDNTIKLRQEFGAEQAVKDYSKALPIFVQGLKTGNTPQGSTSLVYAYATIMDPSSSVREGEADTVSSSDTVFGRAKAFAEKQLDNSGTFSPEARAGLLREMRSKMVQLVQSYDLTRNRYAADAAAFGLDPERVIGPHVAAPFVDDLDAIDRAEGRGIYAEQPEPSPAGEEAGLTGGVVSDDTPSPYDPGGPLNPENSGDYQGSLLGQGMSGVNEGIAGMLGLPVDIATGAINATTGGMNWLGETLTNAPPETGIPKIEDPVLGGDWWKGILAPTIYEPTDDPSAQFVRRTGQSVGSSIVPVGGAANTGRQAIAALLSATAGGMGAATAQQVAPGNIGAEIAAELLASGGTGLGMMTAGRRAEQRALESAIPTVPELKDQAGAVYRRAEQTGATADPTLTQQLADDFRRTLRDEGQIGPSGKITDADTSTTKALNLVEQYAGQPMRPKEMDTVRGVIAEGRRSPDAADQRISKILLDQFDEWARPLVPDFDEARDISSRYLQAQDLELARELAGVRAGQFSGSGFENALRTEYRGLDRGNVKGQNWFNPEVASAIQDVSRGTPLSNAARTVGKFAPTGVVSSVLGMGGPAMVGNMVGGPAVGVATGLAAGGLGTAGRLAATRMGIRRAEVAELLARNGGALPEAPLVNPETERLIAALLAGQQGTYLEEVQP